MTACGIFARSGRWAVLLTAVLAVSGSRPIFGQSLGKVAKETEAQRKTVKSTGKVYTNDTLKSAPAPSQPAPTTPAAEPSPSGVADAKKAEPVKADEAMWRERIKTERDALARAESFASALQSQINGLYGEFTACQAPPQCNEVSAKRQKAIAELERVKKEIETHTKAIADIQEEARKAGVPAGWVR
jgi:hypothetical protein